MSAIYKRDIFSYFVTPIGYVFLATFYGISGFYFFAYQLYSGSSDFSPLFGTLFTFVIFLIPLITMKMFSEEKKYKTDQALLTAPVNLWQVVMGKYFAALTVFGAAISVTIIFLLIVKTHGNADMPVFWGHFLGLFLLGGALTAIGMFVSSLTESQVISAVGTVAFGIFFMFIDSVGNMLGSDIAVKICNYLSFFSHYQDFTTGLLNIADIVYFVSIIFLFCFLTVKVIDKKRWA
ncbi:MAG: ABC transporter permease subunit [Oscillospiraceae bacterium]